MKRLNLTSQVQRFVQWTKLSVQIPTSCPAILGGHPVLKKTSRSPPRQRCMAGESTHPSAALSHTRHCRGKIHGSSNRPVLSNMHEIEVFIISNGQRPVSVKSQNTRINEGVIKNPALNHFCS